MMWHEQQRPRITGQHQRERLSVWLWMINIFINEQDLSYQKGLCRGQRCNPDDFWWGCKGLIWGSTRESFEQQFYWADIQIQLIHVMLTEITDLQVSVWKDKDRSKRQTDRERPVSSASEWGSPVSVSGTIDRRQLSHQQLQYGGFTSSILTHLQPDTHSQPMSAL